MKQLHRVCTATRAISHQASVTFLGVPDRDDVWVIRVAVRDIILFETGAGPLDRVIGEALRKLQALSSRVLAAVRSIPDESPESDDKTPTPSSSGTP